MYLEKRLEQLANDNSDVRKLFGIWCVLKEEFIKILDGVSQYFPHFSLHNESHSKTIAIQIERILGKERIDKLSASDIWLLLMAIYSHDIGMAIRYEEIVEFFNENCKEHLSEYASSKNQDIANAANHLIAFEACQNSTYNESICFYEDMRLIIEAHFRGNHAERSKSYINILMESFNKYSMINVRFVEMLGEICSCHQQNIESISKLPCITNGLIDDYAHPQFIAGMLCLGDLLDLDTDRFNENMLEIVSPLPEDSEIHLAKHKAIRHFLVSPNGIEIISDTTDDRVNRALKSWTAYLRETVEYISLNWSEISPDEFGNPPKICTIKHFKNGNQNWSDYLDLKFSISPNKAMELLQGANIYRNKFAFVKEVTQNAIDASIMRLWSKLRSEDPETYNTETLITDFPLDRFSDYPIKIKVNTDEEGYCIFSIQDKGIGINGNDLKNIAHVGNSNVSKKVEIIHTMPAWIKPSGAFGLGLQSIFMVADFFEIISKTDSDSAKIVKFESGDHNLGYISVSDYEKDFIVGTLLTVRIDKNKVKLNDLSIAYPEFILDLKPYEYWIEEEIYSSFYSYFKIDKPEKIYKYSFFDISFTSEFKEQPKFEDTLSNTQNFINLLQNPSAIDEQNPFNFSYYDNELNAFCEIHFYEPISTGEKDNVISSIKPDYTFKESIHYRNSYINDLIFSDNFKNDLHKYFDFSVNILNYDSSSLLSISRDCFTEEGRKIAYKLVDKLIEETLKKYIDNILKIKIPLKNYAIVMLQICKYFNYNVKLFLEKYKSDLEQYNYGSFYSYNQQSEDSGINLKMDTHYSFEQLSTPLTVIKKKYSLSSLESLCLDENAFCEITEENLKTALSNQNIGKFYDQNVISCKLTKKYFAYNNGNLYECAEFEAMCLNHIPQPELDRLHKIDSYLDAILHDKRTTVGDSNFADLCVLQGFRERKSYSIELPFTSEDHQTIKNNLKTRDNLTFDINAFLSELKKGTYYNAVVKYISKQNKKDTHYINEKMEEFLTQMLKLLFEDSLFEKYIISYVSTGKHPLKLYKSDFA